MIALIVATSGCAATGSQAADTGEPSASSSPAASASTPSVADPSASSQDGTDASQDGADSAQGDGPTEPAVLPTQSADIGEQVSFDTGIDVQITAVEAIEVEAETPGEVSGPAVSVTVTAANGTGEDQSLDSAVVTLVADDDTIGVSTTAGNPSPFSGTLSAGAEATATYVFMLDPAEGRDITVSVNYAAGEPVAVFTGKVS